VQILIHFDKSDTFQILNGHTDVCSIMPQETIPAMRLTRRYCLLCLLWASDVVLAAFSCRSSRLEQTSRRGRLRHLSTAVPLGDGTVAHLGDGSDKTSLTIGFVGCGTIASAIATGLLIASPSLSSLHIKHVVVTHRSALKSAELQRRFPNQVTVSGSNQVVVDAADIVFLTVLPDQTSEVLRDLKFNDRKHTLVSLVSTSKLDSLCEDSGLGVRNVFKMICLPAVAYNEGVCLLQAPQCADDATSSKRLSVLLQLFDSLGGVLIAKDDRQMSAMMVVSGLMGTFYGTLRQNRDWLVEHSGLSPEGASFLVTRYYHGMILDAMREPNFDKLIEDQTPGGLNEQALVNAESLGIEDIQNKVQDAMFRRLLGESDGSL
jgi:pyrroline-5-carboxylate reductase